jgi:uncharacterized repeat protein (TIGR04138 family)
VSATSVAESPKSLWDLVKDHAGPYKPAAFCFVQDGLRHTTDRLFDELADAPDPSDRHVSGQQLCMGLREHAIAQFGPMARTVLASWGIRRTEDFGKVVFALLNAGVLRKTDADSIDDFAAVYDFAEAFGDALERSRA